MIDNLFNTSQYFQNMSQWLDWTKSFNPLNLVPQFNLNKLWEWNKSNINSTSDINNSLANNITAIADKQSAMVRENIENLTNALNAMSQSNMTPQKLLDIQGEFCQKATEQNMKHAKELGEMYTKANTKFLEACSEQLRKNMSECCNANKSCCGSNNDTSTKTT